MSAGKIRDFDESIAFLGEYGFFQLLMMVLLSLSAIPCGYMGVMVVFISDTPGHHCRLPINSTRNGTGEERTSSGAGPDNCSRYKVTGNGTSNETERCEDGWVFSTEEYTSTVVSEVQGSERYEA